MITSASPDPLPRSIVQPTEFVHAPPAPASLMVTVSLLDPPGPATSMSVVLPKVAPWALQSAPLTWIGVPAPEASVKVAESLAASVTDSVPAASEHDGAATAGIAVIPTTKPPSRTAKNAPPRRRVVVVVCLRFGAWRPRMRSSLRSDPVPRLGYGTTLYGIRRHQQGRVAGTISQVVASNTALFLGLRERRHTHGDTKRGPLSGAPLQEL